MLGSGYFSGPAHWSALGNRDQILLDFQFTEISKKFRLKRKYLYIYFIYYLMKSNGTLLWIRFYFVIVQMLSCVQLFVTPWNEACQSSLSFTIFWNLLKLMSVDSVMSFNHLILCRLLLLLPSILPSIRFYYQVTKLCPLLMIVLCLVTQSCQIFCDPMDCDLPGSSVHGDSPDKNTGVGCHALLQGIFPTQGSNLRLLIAGGFFTI